MSKNEDILNRHMHYQAELGNEKSVKMAKKMGAICAHFLSR
jgi:hypothetical protein